MQNPLPDSLSQLAAPPIFIVGLHRSGTTWVYDMLTSHPEVAGVFESGLFSKELGLAPLFAADHWYPDQEGRLESDRRFFGTTFRLNALLDREEMVGEVRSLSGRWLGRALQDGDRYLVEKTPQHLATMPEIVELFPGAAFIHVIRDGRDMVASRQAAALSWPGLHSRSVDVGQTAIHWAGGVTRAREAAEREGLRYAEVRYEEMREDPTDALRRLFEFAGIPADDPLIAGICAQTSLAKQRRGEQDAFRRRGEVGGWRESFGLRDRFRFDRAAGSMLVELGYEQSRSWWLRGRAQTAGRTRIA